MRFRIFLAFAVLCSFALAAAAQQPGPLTQVYQVKPKAGMRTQFEEGAKRHMAWHRAQNDTWEYHVYQIISGENTGSYVAVYPNRNWADYDGRQSFMEQDMADVEKNMGPAVESLTATFYVVRPDLSVMPSGQPPSSLGTIWFFHLHHGAAPEFETAVKRITEAIKKTNWPTTFVWYMLVNGGEQPTYVLVFPRDNWAGLNPPEKPFGKMLEEGLGQAEADTVLRLMGKSVRSQRSELLVHRPDLTYIPAGR